MKVVLDTSVLVAAHIARAGVCSELVETLLADPGHTLYASEYILGEFKETLIGKLKLDPKRGLASVKRWRENVVLVEPAPVPRYVCRDPEDAAILGTAVAARGDLLITVDKDLLILVNYQGIGILKPGAAFSRLV